MVAAVGVGEACAVGGYPAPPGAKAAATTDYGDVAVPLKVQTETLGLLSFFSITSLFGTPLDIILSELALETFLPADPHTAEALRRLAGT